MQKVKYIVVPGYIFSKNDGDLHYISGSQLVRLYKLKPGEYKIISFYRDPRDIPEGAILLYARPDGDYNLPKQGVKNGKSKS